MISFEQALSKLLFLANRIDVEEVNLEELIHEYSRMKLSLLEINHPLMHPQWTVMRSKK